MTPRYISQGSCPCTPEDRPSFGFPVYPAFRKTLKSQRGWRTLVFGLLWE